MNKKYLNKIVNEWSYKVGAIDTKNKEHLYQLEKILIENDWYEDVISEVTANLLNEAATNRTEDLHEIFFAVAFAGGNMSKAKDLNGMIKMINKLSMLDKKKLHIDTLRRFDAAESLFTSKDIKLYQDATQIANKTHTFLKRNKLIPSKVSRVFGTGPGGTKMIADSIITLKSNEIVSVSLKYGKGQFSSLSVPQLVEKMYGIKLKKGLLKDMYNQGFRSEIDSAFEYYALATIGMKDLPVNDKYTQQDKDNLEAIYPKFNEKSTWMDYMNTSIVPVKTRKAFSHIYNHADNFAARGVHKKMKGQLLNNAIDLFFESKGGGIVKNIEDAIIYIIRAEPKTSYLYIASGGKKFALIPSQEAIRGKKYTFKYNASTDDDGIMKTADYVYDVEVSVDGIKAFTFDIKWRFAGQSGQWDGDLQHKGSKIEFHSGFAKAFGLPEIPKDMG